MVVDFEAVQPIGARTCCDLKTKSGSHKNVWLDGDVPEYVQESSALQQGNLDTRVSRRFHLDTVAQLGSLMGRAAKGQLPVGRDNTFPARVMTILPYLLELRPALTKASRVFRLYYAEPVAVENGLLPLVLSSKPASSDNVEQNRSIEDAKARSRTWVLYKVIGGQS